jgi:glutamate racemase
MKNNPIGVFDSGVGGLSVLSELLTLLPQESFIYLADQKYMPYGAKSKDELLTRVSSILAFFQQKNVKAVVMACNTATVFTIEEMREKFAFPILGVVPVIKTVSLASKTGVIAVFATPTTSKSQYLDNLITKYAGNKTVIRIGETHLEDLIEEGEVDSEEVLQILNNELAPLLSKKVDAIALGCTHYPFVKQQIQKIVGDKVLVADSGGAVARRLKQVLENENLMSSQKNRDMYYTTGNALRFEKVANRLLNGTIEAEQLTLS